MSPCWSFKIQDFYLTHPLLDGSDHLNTLTRAASSENPSV